MGNKRLEKKEAEYLFVCSSILKLFDRNVERSVRMIIAMQERK